MNKLIRTQAELHPKPGWLDVAEILLTCIMLFKRSELEKEIWELQSLIQEKSKAFDEGMKQDMPFEELKKVFLERKELAKRLELCFEEVRAQVED